MGYNPNNPFPGRVRIRMPRMRHHNANRMFKPRRFHNAAARSLRHNTRFPGLSRNITYGHLYHQGGFHGGVRGGMYHNRSLNSGNVGGIYHQKAVAFRGPRTQIFHTRSIQHANVGGLYRSRPKFGRF